MDETEFDDIFSGGSPLKKLMDVLINANRNVSENEIDKLFERFCAYELYAEQHGFEDRNFTEFFYANEEEINTRKTSAFIGLVGDIVTRTE